MNGIVPCVPRAPFPPQVGVNYDPMIAKLISTGPDRAAALSSLHSALQQLQVCGGVCVLWCMCMGWGQGEQHSSQSEGCCRPAPTSYKAGP